MDKLDALEEWQCDENVKTCKDCEFYETCCVDENEVCDDFERWVKDE